MCLVGMGFLSCFLHPLRQFAFIPLFYAIFISTSQLSLAPSLAASTSSSTALLPVPTYRTYVCMLSAFFAIGQDGHRVSAVADVFRVAGISYVQRHRVVICKHSCFSYMLSKPLGLIDLLLGIRPAFTQVEAIFGTRQGKQAREAR
jgi:hypothetical protein